jgi:5'-nucleotidase
MNDPLILVTNDDGIDSPGLAAATAALDPLGELLIVAPSTQHSSVGRSLSQQFGADGRISRTKVKYQLQEWDAFAVNATPALAVEHARQEISERSIDLVVSGINYGENIGSCVTVSGTVGAALEAADSGIPAIAISLELPDQDWDSHDESIDFEVAMHFLHFFSSKIIGSSLPEDVDVLKIEVPSQATSKTGWMVSQQDRLTYYTPIIQKRDDIFNNKGIMEYVLARGEYSDNTTDAYALSQGLISVTPLSLDLTSRIHLDELRKIFD